MCPFPAIRRLKSHCFRQSKMLGEKGVPLPFSLL